MTTETTTTETTILIKGLRGRRRIEAKRHNARIRTQARRRDATGRFVTVVNIDVLRIEGVFVNDSGGDTHAHTNCGNLRGRTFTVDAAQDGFLCPACVDVPTPAWVAAHDAAPISGTQVCDTCHREKGMRSFPTCVDAGWRFRGTECRKCERVRRDAARMVRMAEEILAESLEFLHA